MSEQSTVPTQKLLLIDDDPVIHDAIESSLAPLDYEVRSAYTATEGTALLETEHFELVLLDLNLPDANGLEWLAQKRPEVDPQVPVVVVTAHGTVRSAVKALQLGAADFVTKPFGAGELRAVVRRTLTLTRLQRELRAARRESEKAALPELIAASPAMREMVSLAARVATSPSTTVLLLGETGVGKGLLARAIHNASPRHDRPFVAVNCAALPEDLVEAELFGSEKGAFTDAAEARLGLVEEAAGGTLFLDEIGQMPPKTQAKVLTLIEDRTFRRLGSAKERKVDVRLLCATNADLESALADGRFRPDLYYRINVFTLAVPPLRQRREDIPLLAEHFLRELSPELGRTGLIFAPQALAALQTHRWPGNVRELRNCVERAVLLTVDSEIARGELGLPLPAAPDVAGQETGVIGGNRSLAEVDKLHSLAVLRECDGNRTRAAEVLGIARETLQRRLKEWSDREEDA